MTGQPGRLTVTEAATAASVSARTVRRWITAGHLPAEMIGGRRTVTVSDLTAFRPDLSGHIGHAADTSAPGTAIERASEVAKVVEELRRTRLRLDDLTDQLLTAQAEIIRLRADDDGDNSTEDTPNEANSVGRWRRWWNQQRS